MKNPAQTGSGCIRFNDLKVENATFAEYSCPIQYFSYIVALSFIGYC
jgi:hypothetical protein